MSTPRISRRDFLKLASLGGITLGGSAIALAGSDVGQSGVKFEHTILPTPRLPKSYDGFKIGILSDLHLADCGSAQLIEQAISLLNAAEPDLALVAGDYVWINDWVSGALLASLREGKWCSPRAKTYAEEAKLAAELMTSVAEMLGTLKAPQGKLAVLGNHDRWVVPQRCDTCFASAGVKLLVNDYFSVRRGSDLLSVYGADDYWTGIPEQPVFEASSAGAVMRVLLAHNPDYISEVIRNTSVPIDLAVGGHTHGGQICLPVVGAPIYNVEDTKLIKGLVTCYRAPIYISRGVGVVGIPFRLNCPPEAAVITLQSV